MLGGFENIQGNSPPAYLFPSKWKKMRRCLSFLLLSAISGCLASEVDWLGKLETGDYSSVKVGRYPHRTEILKPTNEHQATVSRLREVIELDPELMNRMAEHFYPGGEGGLANLSFRFQFPGIDEENERLILRYFGPIPDPFIYAGYQVQFVFELPPRCLEKIYIEQLPLE